MRRTSTLKTQTMDLGDSLLGRDADAAAEADQLADDIAVLLVGPAGESSHVRHAVAS